MKISMLNRIKELYEKENQNIVEYLKNQSNTSKASIEDILISYDFQAGTYTASYEQNPYLKDKACESVADYINKLGNFDSIIEVGVGEATSLARILKNLKDLPPKSYGLDLSWSRIKYAKQFLTKNQLSNVQLFTGDLFEMPIGDSSIDLVYTFHTLEPNGGREVEALKELYRIAKKYIVLVEPCYDIATDEGKKRMERNGYVKDLYKYAVELNYNVILNESFKWNANDLNPASVMIIKKETNQSDYSEDTLCCPITKTPLKIINGSYYSESSLLAYPIINEIPCLMSSNAIVATKMLD